MARWGRIVRQLPVGLHAHHDRYVRQQAERWSISEADVMRSALDVAMEDEGHTCTNEFAGAPCPACGGTGGQV